MVDTMLSVRDAADTLSQRFFTTLKSESKLERSVAQIRLKEAELRAEAVQLRRENAWLQRRARLVLAAVEQRLESDIALMSFVDALVSVGVSTIEEVNLKSAAIRDRADATAGFAVLSKLPSLRDGDHGRSKDLDPVSMREVFAESIRARLVRTPWAAFLKMANLIDDPSLGYEIRRRYEHLDALTLRVTSNWDNRLKEGAELFMAGRLELSEVARLTGASPADLAVEFERLGYVRPLSTIALSDLKRNELATKIASVRMPPSQDQAVREVIASQRIEGIDARRHFD